MRIRLTLGLIALIAWIATPLRADPLTPFQGDSSPVTLSDIQPHIDQDGNRSNEFYSEWWSFVFQMEDGYGAYVQFLVSNLGPGDGKAVVRATLDLPDGFHLSEKMEYEPGDWEYAKDRFELKLGDNVLGGPMEGLTIHLKNESFEAEYTLENVAPPWKPGNGRVQYGKSSKRYYEFQVIAPVARMKGKVRVEGDDQWQPVKGVLYVDHSLATIGMHEQAQRWLRFRSIDPKSTFLLADISPPSIYGDTSIQYAVLFEGGKKVFDALDFDLKMGNRYNDTKKEGYFAARLAEFKLKVGDMAVHGAAKGIKMTDREDYLETLGAAKRFVLSKFAKPVMYYYNGAFAIETRSKGAKKTYGGKGRYYFTIVNP